MAEEQTDEDRVATRSELVAEERVAGSEDPEAQAEHILEESGEREERVEPAEGAWEHRSSEEATPPA